MHKHVRGEARRLRSGLTATAVAVLSAISCRPGQPPAAAASRTAERAEPLGVACLGRVQPGNGIIRVAARSLGGQASIVKRLFVKEGDSVRAGQSLAELDSQDQLAAAAEQAAARAEVARRHLAQIEAGAKAAEIAAQRTDVERLEAQLAHAQRELERYIMLGDNVTAAELDTRRLEVDAASKAVAAGRQRLTALSEVRGVDVELARAEVGEATHNAARARAEQLASLIRSPIDGRVLRVHAWPGEDVGGEGLLELAPVDPMYVVAEVVESDISRVKVGQTARISGNGLKKPVEGTVERIDVKVLQNQVLSVDPATFSDSRIVNTWIKVNDPQAVANLINLRVDVVIQP